MLSGWWCSRWFTSSEGEPWQTNTQKTHPKDSVELPAPSSWPMVIGVWHHAAWGGISDALGGQPDRYHHYPAGGDRLVAPGDSARGPRVCPVSASGRVGLLPVRTSGRSVATLRVGVSHHRMHVPEKVHPYTAGVWGGLAGGVVMAVLACAYGLSRAAQLVVSHQPARRRW